MSVAKDFGKDRIGQVVYNKTARQNMTLLDYIRQTDCVIQFDNGNIIHTTYQRFKQGYGNKFDKAQSRFGESNYSVRCKQNMTITGFDMVNGNMVYEVTLDSGEKCIESYQEFKFGYFRKNRDIDFWEKRIGTEVHIKACNKYKQKARLIDYNKTVGKQTEITVQFDDGSKKQVAYKNFIEGYICSDLETPLNAEKNPYNRGEAEHHYITAVNSNNICKEWLDFNIFENWFKENFYQCSEYEVCITPELLGGPNAEYNSKNCCFLPRPLMTIINDYNDIRLPKKQTDLPVGIQYNYLYYKGKKRLSPNKPYRVRTAFGSFGRFEHLEDAVDAYYNAKEQHINHMAKVYKDIIPEKIYNALLNYKVQRVS